MVVGFAFQIYLAQQIGPEGLGLFALLQAGVAALSGLLGMGVAQVMVRFIPEHVHKREYAELHALVRGGFALLACISVLGLVGVYLALPALVDRWPDLGDHKSEVMAGAIMLPLGLLLYASTNALRGFYDIRYIVMATSILQLTVKVLFSILIFTLGFYLMGYLWAVNLSMGVALIWMLFGIWRHLCRYPSQRNLRIGLLPAWRRYGQVMYAENLLVFWSDPLEKFILGFTASAAAVGVLAVANTLYILPAVFLNLFLAIVAPMLARAASEEKMEEVQEIYHLTTDWQVRLSFPLVIFLGISAPQLLGIYGETFSDKGTILLQLLVLAQFVNLITGPVGNVLIMCGHERKMFAVTTGGVFFRSILLLAIVPVFGLNGIGLIVILGILVINVSALILAWKFTGLHWWNAKYNAWCLPAALAISVAWVANYWGALNVYGLVALLPLLYLVFHGSYILIHGLSSEDREICYAIRSKLPSSITRYW